jgi:uroporphyrinogen decarboxylase
VLADFGQGHGHVFNLGHGISQFTPPESVTALVEAVHRLSPAYHQGMA